MKLNLDTTAHMIYKRVLPHNKTKDTVVLKKLVRNFTLAYGDSVYNRKPSDNYKFTNNDIDTICDFLMIILRKY